MSDEEEVVHFSTGTDEQGQSRIAAQAPESLPRRISQSPVLTPMGSYIPIEWDGANTSGMEPIGDTILVLPDQPQPITAGGIHLGDDTIEKQAYAAETGVIVEAGDGAWAWNADRTRAYQGTRPGPGTRVWFERYAGSLNHGIDGLIYRGITDKQISFKAKPLPDTHEFHTEEIPEVVIDEMVVRPAMSRRYVRRKPLPQDAAAGPAQQRAMEQGGAAAAPPLPANPPRWPRYLKKDGNMMMAYDQGDANAKAPGEVWFLSREVAEMRGN